MFYLLAVSVLWAFSFGLIGHVLKGLDAQGVAFVRVLISLMCFLPWMRRKPLHVLDMSRLMVIGAVQFGVMYVVYIESFRFLKAHEVALYTITTPIFVTLLEDARRGGRFHFVFFSAALLATVGGAILKGLHLPDNDGLLPGVALIQLSNLCFAAGQVEYRLLCERRPVCGHARHFGFLYLGAALAAGILASGHLPDFRPSPRQWAVLLYLGALPSALGFFLWNRGARQVNAGTLAVLNNLKIPLSVMVSLLVFHEAVDVLRLASGTIVWMAGLVLAGEWRRRRRCH